MSMRTCSSVSTERSCSPTLALSVAAFSYRIAVRFPRRSVGSYLRAGRHPRCDIGSLDRANSVPVIQRLGILGGLRKGYYASGIQAYCHSRDTSMVGDRRRINAKERRNRDPAPSFLYEPFMRPGWSLSQCWSLHIASQTISHCVSGTLAHLPFSPHQRRDSKI